MLAPSEASGIALDSTPLLVLNNACRLGYGSVAILNLFSTLNDYSLKCADGMDIENTNIIVASAKKADTIVYAPGVGKAANKDFIARQEHILTSLIPMQDKLHCLCNRTVMHDCSILSHLFCAHGHYLRLRYPN